MRKVGDENQGNGDKRGFDLAGDESTSGSMGGRQHIKLVYNMGMNQVIHLGWVQLYLFSLIVFFAFLWFGFVFFKKAREYHIEEEVSLNSIMLMGLWGALMARMVFVFKNPDIFVGNWARVLFLKEYAGMDGWGVILGLLIVVFIVVRKTKQKMFDWLDLVSLALAAALPVIEAGRLVIGHGGLLMGVIPEMGIRAALLLGLFWALWKMEKEYRTFDWYRQNKTQANTGFVTAMLILGYGVFKILMPLLIGVKGKWGDLLIGLGLVLVGGAVLYLRSGSRVLEDKFKLKEVGLRLSEILIKKTKLIRRGINKRVK